MADSGSKLLSSICLGGTRSNSNSGSSSSSSHKYGGCVNLFFAHLLDWNKKLTSKGFLKAAAAAERMHHQHDNKKKHKKKQQRISTQKQHLIHEERLPMAKLLLIADENRRSPRKNWSPIGEESNSSNNSSPAVNAVARLMGLEQMPSSPNPSTATSRTTASVETAESKQVSLQELLHLDHEEPRMLQDLLKPQSKQQHYSAPISPSQQDALFSLLMQEVVQSGKDEVPRRSNQVNSKCRNGAFSAPLASSGCGSGFGKSFFLEAAAKILEPRSKRPITSNTATATLDNEEHEDFDLASTRRSIVVRKRGAISAPCSPHHLHRDVSCCSSSTTLTTGSSILELVYDDLEAAARAAAEEEDDYDYFHAMSEPCSPYMDKSSPTASCYSSSSSRLTSTGQREVHLHRLNRKRVPFHDLGEHDYVSFREFLTRSSSSSSLASTPPPSSNHDSTFTMVQNPLFEDHAALASDVGSAFETTSDCGEDTDHGLEEILKSILSDAGKEKTRITWSPQESYIFNKEPSEEGKSSFDEEGKSSLDDSLEATSESNCGDGQPSPVSVLDNSPFDDDLRKDRRPSPRKRLDFDELVAPVLEQPQSQLPTDKDSFKSSEVEVLDYANMVLRECGVEHRKETLLLLLEPCILGDELFDRLEDRMRVEELIKHLEAYNKGSNNKTALKTHSRSYHECRAQRRLVFEITRECLDAVLEDIFNDTFLVDTRSKGPYLSTGRDVVEEVESRVAKLAKNKFDNIDQMVDMDFSKEWGPKRHTELVKLVLRCEEDIFRGLVNDLANDLLAL